jgi:superoxide dismutase
MTFKLAALPYGYDALEPSVDATTMQIHHDKHHATCKKNPHISISSQTHSVPADIVYTKPPATKED